MTWLLTHSMNILKQLSFVVHSLIAFPYFSQFWLQMPRHNNRPLYLVRGEPQRSGGLLSSLAIDSRGLASRTCPRIDPIVRAIAHSCARDWTLPTAPWALRVSECAIYFPVLQIKHSHVANRHRVKTVTYPTIYWTGPNRWLDIGSVGGGGICCLGAHASPLDQDDVSCWNSTYPPY